MANEQGRQPSLAATISDSLRDVIRGRVSSFLQTLEASSDSPNVSKAMGSWAIPSDAESTRSPDDMDNDEILALTLEAEELAAVKAATQEASAPTSQAGAKTDSHSHKHCCTVDGTCTRDLWLRGMVTLACASFILLS